MTQPTRRVRAIVTGQVQGVGFRYAARAQAGELGLAGWARNLPDGTVEVEAEGAPDAIERMLSWLGTGPRDAAVLNVEATEMPVRGEDGFTIRD